MLHRKGTPPWVHKVEDEESQQTKSWRFLFSRCKIRGDLESELAHPYWNAFKRALVDADLQESSLELSICANFSHGSFLSGDKHAKQREVLSDFMSQQSDCWFDDIATELGLHEEDPSSSGLLYASDVLNSGGIRRRGKFDPCSQAEVYIGR